MTTEEDGRNAAVTKYRILALVVGILGVGLLVCGGLAVSYETYSFGPPYFVGCFVVGIMALIQALLCGCIFTKGPDTGSDDVKKRQVACAINGLCKLAMFTFLGCFLGVVLAGISGNLSGINNRPSYRDEDEHAKEKKTLAIITFVCCFLMFFINIFTLYMVCRYGSFFGVAVTRKSGLRTMVTNTTQQGNGGASNLFASTFEGAASNNIQIQQLQTQNMLLQQQLELQRQLAAQQQQPQPTQFSGGMYPPPPPPLYSDIAYPPTASFPSAPPPSYDKISP